jgi:hypothetical protein
MFSGGFWTVLGFKLKFLIVFVIMLQLYILDTEKINENLFWLPGFCA